jgi:hypothetical protein
MSHVLESHYSRRVALLLIGLGVFVALLPNIISIRGHMVWTAQLVGVSCLATAGWMLIDRRVKLRIDDVGIRYSRWGDFTIPWAELQGAEVREVRRNAPVVQLLTREEFDLHARVPLFWRLCGSIMRPSGVDEFAIAAGGLEHGVEQIRAVIHSHLARR